ncbi:unnamed protein product [Rhodiola kirilowii]
MSREGSHHDYQDDDEMNLYGRNYEAPPPFLNDPEHLIQNQGARNQEGVQRNQEPPEDQNEAGPIPPLRHPPLPQHQKMPRRGPIFDDYGDNNYRTPTMELMENLRQLISNAYMAFAKF